MFHFMINRKTAQLIVFTNESMKHTLVKFASNRKNWTITDEKVIYKSKNEPVPYSVDVRPGHNPEFVIGKLNQKALAMLTADMTPVWMSAAYQKHSGRGIEAFLKAVNSLKGNGIMEVEKIYIDNQPTTYKCTLFNTRGVAALEAFSAEVGKRQLDKIHNKNHQPKKVGEFHTTYETYKRASAFRQSSRQKSEDSWIIRL